MRPFVHEPMNTRSILIDSIGTPASRPMYSSARRAPSRAASSLKLSGPGTLAESGTTMPGFVPHVTCGSSFDTSMRTVLS
jgi:hypothetical protein